ncbi:MAG TPA: hypothetical protein V6D11_33060 [Waterburya sp.]|jgi:hypothetical protein
MARSKKNDATQTITDAINAPTGEFVADIAEKLNIPISELRERLASKLDNDDALDWDVVTPEHLALVDAIARDLDAESSVRRLEATAEPPIPTPEPPIVEDEPQPKKRGGRSKKTSTALTQRKFSSLKESDQKAQQLAVSDQQVKVKLHAAKGQKSGAQLATIELAAEDATYRQIKGQALVRKVGQLTSEIASESDFDPIQVLAELGIDSNSEIFEDLRQHIEPALGKLESATAEIVDNAWVNGINLETELGNLENLMSSNGFTSDYWQ